MPFLYIGMTVAFLPVVTSHISLSVVSILFLHSFSPLLGVYHQVPQLCPPEAFATCSLRYSRQWLYYLGSQVSTLEKWLEGVEEKVYLTSDKPEDLAIKVEGMTVTLEKTVMAQGMLDEAQPTSKTNACEKRDHKKTKGKSRRCDKGYRNTTTWYSKDSWGSYKDANWGSARIGGREEKKEGQRDCSWIGQTQGNYSKGSAKRGQRHNWRATTPHIMWYIAC